MKDLIAAGSISIDLYFRGKSLTFKNSRFQLALGGKYTADFFHLAVGGGAVNVAIGAAKFGLRTAILGTIGDNIFKPIIFDKLKKADISYRLCDIVKGYYNISSIILADNGERSIIHFATFNQKLFDHGIKLTSLKEAKIIYLGNLSDISFQEKVRILTFAKKNNILTVLNLGNQDCRLPKKELLLLLKNTDILILNGHEFANLVKAQYKDIFFEENVINHYIPQLSDKLVVITEGEKGSFAYWQNKIFYQKAKKVEKIVDTTGCGDGYTAAFIANYYKTFNIEESMEKAADYAAKILSHIGAN